MQAIFKIFYTDLKRIVSNVVAVVIILGLCILPCLYAWFNIFSNWDPYGPDSTKNIAVAVLSLDQGANIAGVELNVGDSVVSALESNTTIGWVFTESLDETVKGVESGEYYAALVMQENFSEQMISFVNGDIENPSIIYYENSKKNAIAPKITQKAQKSVKEQVNATFVSTLAETLLKATNAVTAVDKDGVTVAGSLVGRLDDLSGEIGNYITVLNSMQNIMSSASNILTTTQLMLPNIENITGSTAVSLDSMRTVANSAQITANSVDSMIISAFDMLNTTMTTVANATTSAVSSVNTTTSAMLSGINTARTLVPYAKELFNSAVSSFEGNSSDEVKQQINDVRFSFDMLSNDMDALYNAANTTVADINNINSHLQNDVATCQNGIAGLKNSYTGSVSPQVKQTINLSVSAINSAIDIADTISTDFGGLNKILTNYNATVEDGSGNLNTTLELANSLLDTINTTRDNLSALTDNENYDKLLTIMKEDPNALGGFISSPVSMDIVEVYPIENYGSATAPFYSILAIWVGSLILVAIIHVHVHPIEGMAPIKPYQAYFGRYITFFIVGQLQALITVLGDLFFIEIQCLHPFMFWFACSICSFVFTLFIYSLTVAFENIGEAIAVVVMVIQVAGAGCTFPIETLPKVFHIIYDYLPFQFGMNAMKEAICGLYENDYWGYLGGLLVYVGVSLVIGLLLAIPCRKLNRIIEHSKERSGVML